MFNLPKRPAVRALTAGVSALALAASGAAVAQSSPNAKPAHAPGDTAAHNPTPVPLALTAATLSDSVGFDIRGPNNMIAEVRPGTNPSFRFAPIGWTGVTRGSLGHYCINGGVVNGKTFDYPAVVSVTSIDTPGIGYVKYDSHGTGCPGVGVWTYVLS